MTTACEYGLRSRDCGGRYPLRSKGSSPPPFPIRNPKIHKSRPLLPAVNPKPAPDNNAKNPSLISTSTSHPRLPLYMRRKASKPKHDFLADPFPPGCEKTKERAVRFANTALAYLRERGQNFELVNPDLHQGATISGGARFHCNFKAKRANDPSAPVETFFAQLHYTRDRDQKLVPYKLKDLVAECCVSLGESDSLPKERDNRGCVYCSEYVHHPVDGCEGIEWGHHRR